MRDSPRSPRPWWTAALVLAGLLWGPSAASGQGWGVTLEGQAYPAGWVGRVGPYFRSGVWTVAVTSGYNTTDRRDWGEHENEQGGGAGGGLRWIRASRDGGGWYGEGRLDLWFLSVDWRQGEFQGRTRVRVVQPMVGAGYGWPRGWGLIRAGLALGLEINTAVRGEPIGEGPILSAGLSLDLGR